MNFFTTLALAFIRAYQKLISPFFPSTCRFHPTCSQYAHDAIRLHGPVRGTGMALRRVSKCHPWHIGGVDPVEGSRGGDVR